MVTLTSFQHVVVPSDRVHVNLQRNVPTASATTDIAGSVADQTPPTFSIGTVADKVLEDVPFGSAPKVHVQVAVLVTPLQSVPDLIIEPPKLIVSPTKIGPVPPLIAVAVHELIVQVPVADTETVFEHETEVPLTVAVHVAVYGPGFTYV
jgi:hypothetical protein